MDEGGDLHNSGDATPTPPDRRPPLLDYQTPPRPPRPSRAGLWMPALYIGFCLQVALGAAASEVMPWLYPKTHPSILRDFQFLSILYWICAAAVIFNHIRNPRPRDITWCAAGLPVILVPGLFLDLFVRWVVGALT